MSKNTPAEFTEPAAVTVRGLRKRFGALEVLKGIDLVAHKGDVVALIGGSGSGKSTTLRCINMLETPSGGSISIHGEEIRLKQSSDGDLIPADKRQLRAMRTKLGMVFQDFNLWQHLTIEQNVVEAPIHVLGQPKAQAREKAHDLLNRVGLFDKRDQYPAFLSGGQQQRAAIARALAMDPEVILFDEPTSSLDPELVGEVLTVMRGLAEDGRTMIIVTHEMGFAADVASEVLFLNAGYVEERGPPDKLFGAPDSERLKQFMASVR